MNPLTGIYGGASALRNALFDRGFLPSRRLARPVVSVGNLSVGGSGKTPFVIALGELLKARGIAFDVLSRGYGRKSRDVLMVDPKGTVAEFGDEPLLIVRQLGVPVIVGESRYEAGKLAERRLDSQVHILDDGFQHRSLFRDFDIVLVTAQDFKDKLLPSGRLREPFTALARADAIVLPAELNRDGRELFSEINSKMIWRAERVFNLATGESRQIAFCGVARPEQFFRGVRQVGVEPAEEIVFRDHHAYSESDIKRLLRIRARTGARGFVTTEKDAVNLGRFSSQLQPLSIAKLTVKIADSADVLNNLLHIIRNRNPGS
jgi:tetraacyldisaccharide 4'-kinase